MCIWVKELSNTSNKCYELTSKSLKNMTGCFSCSSSSSSSSVLTY